MAQNGLPKSWRLRTKGATSHGQRRFVYQRDPLDSPNLFARKRENDLVCTLLCIRPDLPRVISACWLDENRWQRARGASAVLAVKTLRASTLLHYGAEDCSCAEHPARRGRSRRNGGHWNAKLAKPAPWLHEAVLVGSSAKGETIDDRDFQRALESLRAAIASQRS